MFRKFLLIALGLSLLTLSSITCGGDDDDTAGDDDDTVDDDDDAVDDDDDNNDTTTDDDDNDNNDDDDTTENISPVVNMPEELYIEVSKPYCFNFGCTPEQAKKACPLSYREGINDHLPEGLYEDMSDKIYDPDGEIVEKENWSDYGNSSFGDYNLCTEFGYSEKGDKTFRIEVTDNDGATSYGETIIHVE